MNGEGERSGKGLGEDSSDSRGGNGEDKRTLEAGEILWLQLPG